MSSQVLGPHNMAAGFLQSKWLKGGGGVGGGHIVFFDLALEVLYHHVLFKRSELLGPSHTQGKEN